MKLVALFKDSILQTLDCKSLYVSVALGALFVLVCASISYSPMDEREAIQGMVEQFDRVMIVRTRPPGGRTFEGVTWTVSDVRKGSGDFEGGYEFKLAVSNLREFHDLVRFWRGVEQGKITGSDDPVPEGEVDEAGEIKFLRGKFRERVIMKTRIERGEASEDKRVFDVAIRAASPERLEGMYQAHFFFGAFSWPLGVADQKLSVAQFMLVMQLVLSQYVAGMVGILFGVIFTASFIPTMLQKGCIDVLLARPISRTTLLLSKYAGGLIYGAISGGVLVGGSWLVLSLRSGVWNWGYLASLGTLILFFAVLYSIGALTAVMTRSTIASMIVPVGAWGLGFGVTWVKQTGTQPLSPFQLPSSISTALEALSWFLPRASDINVMNQWFMICGSMGPGVEEITSEMGLPEVAWIRILLSSGALIVATLGLASFVFSRRDY
ncbi:MAG: ABC transporter permease [Planctomycetes bacterium]|nr:ABC transporter permease [Planctomycetota bacterium]